MRSYIKEEIMSGFHYRNSDGMPLCTISIGFLLSSEISEIIFMGFKVIPITTGYNLIVFPQNFEHDTL